MRDITTAEAFDRIRDAIAADKDYAWAWHCSVACSAQDEGVDSETSQRIATRFIELAFNVKTWPKMDG